MHSFNVGHGATLTAVTYYIVVKGFWHTLESYLISVTEYEIVATETRDWSDVKALFR